MKTPIGVLLLQLGTPDAPTPAALKPYLREFLGDPRVIEAPRLLWWFILNFSILRKRPAQSAAKYQRIWDAQTGSPLLHYTRLQAEKLQNALADGFLVRFGMRYGSPATASVVHDMIRQGIDRLVVLPMYPQYSGTTTGSALDGLFQSLMRERCIPALRIVAPYYEHPAYLDALAGVIRENKQQLGYEPDHHIISFHGIPLAYTQKGDPYARHVQTTTKGLVEKLAWKEGTWSQAYQSLFGKEKWLEPYTDRMLQDLANLGKRRVFVALPGFTADCLETIDEIGNEYREIFLEAGGQELFRCPCLNDHPLWIAALKTLVLEEARNWAR